MDSRVIYTNILSLIAIFTSLKSNLLHYYHTRVGPQQFSPVDHVQEAILKKTEI
jgi:hypothetical protein